MAKDRSIRLVRYRGRRTQSTEDSPLYPKRQSYVPILQPTHISVRELNPLCLNHHHSPQSSSCDPRPELPRAAGSRDIRRRGTRHRHRHGTAGGLDTDAPGLGVRQTPVSRDERRGRCYRAGWPREGTRRRSEMAASDGGCAGCKGIGRGTGTRCVVGILPGCDFGAVMAFNWKMRAAAVAAARVMAADL